MTLPDLSRLSLKSADASEPHEEWLELCGTMPKFTAWRRLRGGKRYIHELADRSENDRFSNGQLVTVYGMTDIDELERPSIEHVWPQSKTDGGRRSAKADWFGFEIVEQRANSARGNRPLVLWPTFNTKRGTVYIGSEPHYDFPDEMKARVARKWLYLRATYHGALDPISRAQTEHKQDIINNVTDTRIGYAEGRWHGLLVKHFGGTWRNPLYDDPDGDSLALAARLAF